MMTENHHDQDQAPIPTIVPLPLARWLKRRWSDFANYSRGTTTRRNVWAGGLVIALGFLLISHQQDELGNRALDTARAQAATDLFQTELIVYNQQVANFVFCTGRVGASLDNREQWRIVADKLEVIGGADFADEIRNGPLMVSAPPSIENDCTEPGDPPVDPDA